MVTEKDLNEQLYIWLQIFNINSRDLILGKFRDRIYTLKIQEDYKGAQRLQQMYDLYLELNSE